jgi:acetolactate decarboxylase
MGLRHIPLSRFRYHQFFMAIRRYTWAGTIVVWMLAGSGVAGLAQINRGNRLPAPDGGGGVLYQVSTLDALLQGLYNGSTTVGQLKQYGDFGLGTYEGLDGEMIVLDGHFYHMRSNGVLSEAADDEVAPFAVLTHFRPETQFTVGPMAMADLSNLIDTLLPSRNYFYAIRIHGAFSAMSTRAIPQQVLPYPPLAQLIPIQSVFTYPNTTGTAVDIRSPAFVSGINQTAHHFHYVSDDLKGGGHALSFTTGQVVVSIQTLRRFEMSLPGDELFQKATLPYQQ